MCMCKPPKGTGMCKQRLLHGFIQLGVCHTPVFCTENYPAKFFKNLFNNLCCRTSFVKCCINPRHACTATVIVLGLSVCLSVTAVLALQAMRQPVKSI